jgi:hypothetical protein
VRPHMTQLPRSGRAMPGVLTRLTRHE